MITILVLPYAVPNKLFFAVLIGLLSSILFCVFISSGKNLKLSFRLNLNVIFLGLYALSIAFISTNIFSDFNLSIFSNDLSALTLYHLFALTCTLLVLFILPGYAFTAIFNVKNHLSTLERVTFVFLSSISISAFIGFIAWCLGSFTYFGSIIAVAVNTVILITYIARNFKNLRTLKIYDKIIDYRTCLVIFLIVLFCFLAFFSIHNIQSNLPIYGDELDHVKLIVKFLTGYSSWQEQSLGILSTPTYPYFFHLFEGLGVLLSSLSVSSYFLISSLILIPLPLLAFISLAWSLTNGNRNITILSAIVFQIFSGFGWIYAVANYNPANEINTIFLSSVSTGDIIYSTWFPTITAPFLLDYAVFLFALNFSLKRNIALKKSLIILLPLLVTAFFAHIEKIVLLSAIIFLLLILQSVIKSQKFQIKNVAIALIVTCVAAFALDFLAPNRLLVSSLLNSTFVILLLSSVTLILCSILPRLHFPDFKEMIKLNARFIGVLVIVTFLFFMLFELFLQIKSVDNFAVVPYYYFPIKLGIGGFFAIVFLLMISHKSISKFSSLLLLLSAVFVLDFFLYHSYYPLYSFVNSFVEEFRFIRDVLWPLIAIAGSIGIYVTFKRLLKSQFKNKLVKINVKTALLCAIIVAFLFTGAFSNLLKVEYSTALASPDSTTMSIVEFMANQSIPNGSAIFAASSIARTIGSVTGAVVYTPETPFYGSILGKSNDYSSILFTLHYLNISYVIISKTDSSCLSQLVKYCPVTQLGEYAIYEVTSFSSPSLYSDTLLLNSNTGYTDSMFSDELSGAIVWKDEFNSANGWEPDDSTFANVANYLVVSDQNVLSVQASGTAGSKIVMFYKLVLPTPIPVETETNIVVRFNTSMSTALIVHVLYSDGTQSNTVFNDNVYMQSSSWTSSETKLDCNKTIVGFRIGVSNLLNKGQSEVTPSE